MTRDGINPKRRVPPSPELARLQCQIRVCILVGHHHELHHSIHVGLGGPIGAQENQNTFEIMTPCLISGKGVWGGEEKEADRADTKPI